MNKINLKGVTAEAVTGVIILLVALINAGLQMFGINTISIADADVSSVVSLIFVIITALYNAWKNRNVTTVAQKMQVIADAVKNGELLEKDIEDLIQKIKK